jgi:hypothetical protein
MLRVYLFVDILYSRLQCLCNLTLSWEALIDAVLVL